MRRSRIKQTMSSLSSSIDIFFSWTNHIDLYATNDYLEELLRLYARNLSTDIIPAIPYDADGIAKKQIENFVVEILNTIGENIVSPVVLSELIYFYRTIMSVSSSWQTKASQLVWNSIKSSLNLISLENNDADEMKTLLGSLRVLGVYMMMMTFP